ncbi:MAG: hypothetical protein R2764_15605 [Bacteroidales bacterium]
MIEVQKLTKVYGNTVVLDIPEMQINKGESSDWWEITVQVKPLSSG